MLDKITLRVAEFGIIYHLARIAREAIVTGQQDTAASYLATVTDFMRKLANEADEKARAV